MPARSGENEQGVFVRDDGKTVVRVYLNGKGEKREEKLKGDEAREFKLRAEHGEDKLRRETTDGPLKLKKAGE